MLCKYTRLALVFPIIFIESLSSIVPRKNTTGLTTLFTIKEIISKNVFQVLSQITAKGRTDSFFREEGMELTKKRVMTEF